MANNKIEILSFPDNPDTYTLVPVAPTETVRGGIKAKRPALGEDNIEVTATEEGLAYVKHDPTKLNNTFPSTDNGKFLKVNADGSVTPVALESDITSSYNATTKTLTLGKPGFTEIPIDSSLSVSGRAADAAAVKSEIDRLNSLINKTIRESLHTITGTASVVQNCDLNDFTENGIYLIESQYRDTILNKPEEGINGQLLCFVSAYAGESLGGNMMCQWFISTNSFLYIRYKTRTDGWHQWNKYLTEAYFNANK